MEQAPHPVVVTLFTDPDGTAITLLDTPDETPATTERNVHIDVNGQAAAGLWFHLDAHGRLIVELGQWPDGETWQTTSCAVLTHPLEHP